MHLTVRMAWHDNKWNGKVCSNPEENVYCTGTNSLLSDRIAQNKNVDLEKEYSETDIQLLPSEYQVPCYWSLNAFSDTDKPILHSHAFTGIKHKIPETLKAYSVFTWPFKLSFVHNDENKKKYGNYPPDLEKRVDKFIEKFPEKQSIIFFYANYDNPVSADEMKYLLLGCSLISEKPQKTWFPLSKEELDYYRKKPQNKYFPTLNWSLQFTHAFKDYGILLPYHEYLRYIEENPADEEKLSEIKAVVDEPSIIPAFKYVAMDMDDDKCLFLLYKIRKSLHKIEEHGFVADQDETKTYLDRINKLIQIAWSNRGLYPSLKHIFKYFDMDEEAASRVSTIINEQARTSPLSEVFNQLRDGDVPDYLEGFEDELLEVLDTSLFIKNIEIFKRLALVNLTCNQIEKIIKDQQLLKQFYNNPYSLYERYLPDEIDLDNTESTDEEIDFYKIDLAFMPDIKFLKKDKALQKMKPDSPERLRAVITSHLYQIGSGLGHCYDSDTNILKVIKEYPLFYKSDIKIDEESLLSLEDEYKNHFQERLFMLRSGGSQYYYLKEAKFAEDAIKQAFEKLAKIQHKSIQLDFSDYIQSSIQRIKEKNPHFDDKTFSNERGLLYRNVLKQAFYILTGRAGSGKTEETSKIISTLTSNLNEKVVVLAPTGKAVLRIAENLKTRGLSTYVTPKTIDKFIFENGFKELLFSTDYSGILELENAKKIRLDNLIIDECSMVDLFKMAILFSIIDLDSVKRIILVGDEYQLPPIGFGKPYKDIIEHVSVSEFKNNHYIRLESNCRIMESSPSGDNKILELAEIFTSQSSYFEPILSAVDQDIFESDELHVYKWTNKEDLEQKIYQQFDRLIEQFGYDPKKDTMKARSAAVNLAFNLYDNGCAKNFSCKEIKLDTIQLLSPYRSGYYGTLSLNKNIQTTYRDGYPKWNKVFKHGDKIIRLFNWYNKRTKEMILSNGSIGLVNYNKDADRYLFSELDYPLKWIDNEDNFDLAYAITVHKSQGSDFENVFLVIPRKYALLSKELIYTALTRGKTRLFVFIQENQGESLWDIARKTSFVDRRNTSVFSTPTNKTGTLQPAPGVWVESKVEYIIYKALQESGLKFEYEEKLKLPHRGFFIKPDFKITLSDGSVIYWEHLGLLNKESYVSKWMLKKSEYTTMGLMGNLVTTDDLGGIDEQKLLSVIDHIRQKKLVKSSDNRYSNHHYTLY
ncbi:AAA family ATPase [Paenibacillus mesotrionivorans]|uniref:AAA family ATPase n=1 Tax=Paenibacillus mesotrionivorans TaxID=3160968 RepID=A0ACC7NV15_9BACL